MKWSEIEKLAREHGWSLYRNGKKHDIYRKEGHPGEIQIERHWSQEVRPGLLRKLLNQLEGEWPSGKKEQGT